MDACMAHALGLLWVLFLLSATSQAWALNSTSTAKQMLCQQSGYACSKGTVQPWLGDFSLPGKLADMVYARTFKKEIIVLFATGHGHWLMSTLQTWYDLDSQGFSHTITILEDEVQCKTAVQYFYHFGCTWSTDPMPKELHGVRRIHHLRHRLSARLLRMGINVLNIDTDVFFVQDPYLYLKSPPLMQYKLITQAEAGGINVGIMYAHNVGLNSSTLWLWAEVADRYLRLGENATFLRTKDFPSGVAYQCATWEQSMANEALWSGLKGRPVFFSTFGPCADQRWKDKYDAEFTRNNTQWLNLRSYYNEEKMRAPDYWAPAVWNQWDSEFKVYSGVWNEIGMPNYQGEWPRWMGGEGYPPKRGVPSQTFIDQMTWDNQVPLWPAVDDASQAHLARDMPKEKVLSQAPDWLMGPWMSWGRRGCWWPTKQYNVGAQVIAHVHVTGCGADRQWSKFYIQWVLGHASWDVIKRVRGSHIYTASTHHDRPPNIIALSPRFDYSALKTSAQLKIVLRGMLKLALVSKRSFVWPDFPCMGPPWAVVNRRAPQGLSCGYGIEVRDDLVLYGPHDEPKCAWLEFLHFACLHFNHDTRTMMSTELEEYVRRENHTSLSVSSGEGGMLLPVAKRSVVKLPVLGEQLEVHSVSEQQVLAFAEHHKAVQIWYLEQPLDVELEGEMQAKFHDYVGRECSAIRDQRGCF